MTKNNFDHFDLDHFDTRTPASLEIDTRLSVIFTATTATNCNKTDCEIVKFLLLQLLQLQLKKHKEELKLTSKLTQKSTENPNF